MEISCEHSGLVDVRPIFVGVMVTLSMEEALRDVELQPDPIKYFSDKMDNHAQYIIEGTNLFSFTEKKFTTFISPKRLIEILFLIEHLLLIIRICAPL